MSHLIVDDLPPDVQSGDLLFVNPNGQIQVAPKHLMAYRLCTWACEGLGILLLGRLLHHALLALMLIVLPIDYLLWEILLAVKGWKR